MTLINSKFIAFPSYCFTVEPTPRRKLKRLFKSSTSFYIIISQRNASLDHAQEYIGFSKEPVLSEHLSQNKFCVATIKYVYGIIVSGIPSHQNLKSQYVREDILMTILRGFEVNETAHFTKTKPMSSVLTTR